MNKRGGAKVVGWAFSPTIIKKIICFVGLKAQPTTCLLDSNGFLLTFIVLPIDSCEVNAILVIEYLRSFL